MKQIVLTVLIGTAFMVILFGPRPDSGIPADRRSDTIVTYWEKWTGKDAAAMQRIVDDFNSSVGLRDHIYVQFLSMSGIDSKTRLAMAAGIPPDIAGVWDNTLAQYVSEDALMPLDDMAAEYGITADMYKKVYWNGCHWGGHLWALPSTAAVIALHYNKDEFRAAGLDPDHPPRTIDELDLDADRLNIWEANGQLERAGYLTMEPGWYITETHYWFGGPDIFDPATQKFNLTDPRTIAAYQWVADRSKKMGINSAMTEFHLIGASLQSVNNPFIAGTVAMEQQGPWMANIIEEYKPSMMGGGADTRLPIDQRKASCHWAAAPFPTLDGKSIVAYCPFDALVIPRGAKHKHEAFEFIAFASTQVEMEKQCELHYTDTPLKHPSADFFKNHPNPYIDVFEKLADSPDARGTPQIPNGPEVGDLLNTAVEQIYRLEKTPQQALLDAQIDIQAHYDQWRQMQKARGLELGL